MATPWLTDAGAGRRLRWSLDIVELCSVQWAEAMVGLKEECITVVTKFPLKWVNSITQSVENRTHPHPHHTPLVNGLQHLCARN